MCRPTPFEVEQAQHRALTQLGAKGELPCGETPENVSDKEDDLKSENTMIQSIDRAFDVADSRPDLVEVIQSVDPLSAPKEDAELVQPRQKKMVSDFQDLPIDPRTAASEMTVDKLLSYTPSADQVKEVFNTTAAYAFQDIPEQQQQLPRHRPTHLRLPGQASPPPAQENLHLAPPPHQPANGNPSPSRPARRRNPGSPSGSPY